MIKRAHLSTCICENSNYLQFFADASGTKFNETVIVRRNLLTKKTNTITANYSNKR